MQRCPNDEFNLKDRRAKPSTGRGQGDMERGLGNDLQLGRSRHLPLFLMTLYFGVLQKYFYKKGLL